jgi:hypothetical protein
MWNQIFLNNYENIKKEKEEFIKFLKNFKIDKNNFLKVSIKYKKLREKLFEK